MRSCSLAISFLFWVGAFGAGLSSLVPAAEQYNFTGVKIPLYREGRLAVEICAEEAHDIRLENTRRLESAKLSRVTLFIYETARRTSSLSRAPITPESIQSPPPLRFRITGDNGTFVRREKITTLQGNVSAVRYDDRQNVQAVVESQNVAWDETHSMLTSTGPVRLTRGEDVLEGEDLEYFLTPGSRPDEDSLQGEVIRLKKNVRMTLQSMQVIALPASGKPQASDREKAPASIPTPTHVTCKGRADYFFADNAIFFYDHVELVRGEMHIQGDNLMVKIEADPRTNVSQAAELHVWPAVLVTGRQRLGTGEMIPYRAVGKDAVYIAQRGLLSLSGEKGRQPEVWYGTDWIRHKYIDFKLGEEEGMLIAGGDESEPRGEARLQARLYNPDAKTTAPTEAAASSPEATRIAFQDLVYDPRQGTAAFRGGVETEHPDFSIRSDALLAETPESLAREGLRGVRALGVRHVTAEGNVRIQTKKGQKAIARKAIFDTAGQALNLEGPSPDPVIEEPGKSRIRAARITSIRISDPTDPTQLHDVVHAEGPGEMVITETGAPRGANTEADTTRILFSEAMEYDESLQVANFTGGVQLARGEVVVNGGWLEIHMEPVYAPKAGADKLLGFLYKKIIGRDGVEMHAEGRNTSCDHMIYALAPDDTRTITMFSGDKGQGAHLGGAGKLTPRGAHRRLYRPVPHRGRRPGRAHPRGGRPPGRHRPLGHDAFRGAHGLFRRPRQAGRGPLLRGRGAALAGCHPFGRHPLRRARNLRQSCLQAQGARGAWGDRAAQPAARADDPRRDHGRQCHGQERRSGRDRG
ncbi:MAG: hypothetical protein V1918_01465 [Planctomycetota bacterium]